LAVITTANPTGVDLTHTARNRFADDRHHHAVAVDPDDRRFSGTGLARPVLPRLSILTFD
jgi:hypothetical protein